MSKQYNFYLNSTDASYNTTTCVYTFNVNWNILPQDINFFDLEVTFNSVGQILCDYATLIQFGTGKVMCNLRDAFSYDSNTNSSNSSCLCYIQKTNEYIDNGRFYKGCSYQNVQFLGQKKTVIRPTDPNLTIFIYNYQALLNKETFYGNFPKYELGQLTSTPGKIILNPFQIILTFKPIKNI